MSLLMQALKKAEHAKKTAAPGADAVQAAAHYPKLDETIAFAPEPVIVTPPAQTAPAAELQLSLADKSADSAPADLPPTPMVLQDLMPSPPPRQSVDQVMQSQQQAQSVFKAKESPRANRSFSLLALTLLVILVLSAGAFYYWQSTMQSNTPPARAIARVDAQPVNSVTVSSDVATQTAVAAAPANIRPNKPEATPRAAQPSHAKPTHQADTEQIQISKSQLPAKINATLTQAYTLFTSGDRNGARPLYESVLRDEPNNRDALLGIAAIELTAHHNEQAAALYSRLLDLDPNDAEATAALTSLRRDNPEQSESQLKKVLARNPQSGATLFELGNLYGGQARWSEAQDMYFRAYSSAPKNADYAFNLAISLDRLGQTRLALDYYQKALALSATAPGNFSPDAAANRINDLQQSVK